MVVCVTKVKAHIIKKFIRPEENMLIILKKL
jgi:hypothetical protein